MDSGAKLSVSSPIGIFDSGLGGLSVFQSIKELLPLESTVYLADHQHFPYGEKSTAEVKRLSLLCLGWLVKRKVKLIVVACNSSTVAGIYTYRKRFAPLAIVGVVPVVKTAAKSSKTGKIAVLSTPETAESTYQKWLIDSYARDKKVYSIGLRELASLVEKGKLAGREVRTILRRYLEPLMQKNIDVIALGCTHYVFLKPAMEAIVGKRALFIDSGLAVARQVKRVLASNKDLSEKKNAEYSFYTTGDAYQVTTIARRLIGKDVTFEHVAI